jgi:DNA polymerase III subunit delta
MRPITLIASDSEFLADLEARALRSRAQSRGEQVELLDVGDPLAVSYALGTSSLFGDERLMVLQGDVKQIEQHVEALKAFGESPIEGTRVVIVTTSAKTLGKKLGAGVETIELASPKPWETDRWVIKHAKSIGRVIDPSAAKLLVDTIGTDLRDLSTAIDTLNLGTTGSIDEKAVAAQFQGHETALFTFLEKVLERDRGAALRDLRSLLGSGDHPLVVHAALTKQFRSLAAIHGLRDQDQPTAKELDVAPGYMRRATRAMKRWDADAIRRAIVALAETDLAIKGGFEGEETPETIIIELLVVELTASREEIHERAAAH